MVPPPGWFKEPKLSWLNTLGALLWDPGGLEFRGCDVFCRLPWDLGGVTRPEKDDPISSSNW